MPWGYRHANLGYAGDFSDAPGLDLTCLSLVELRFAFKRRPSERSLQRLAISILRVRHSLVSLVEEDAPTVVP